VALEHGQPSVRLPYAEQARVAPEKVLNYLLSTDNEDGKDKARFFLRFGFTRDEWQVFSDALRAHAVAHEVANIRETPHGMNYAVDGILETPDGRNPRVLTVWRLAPDSETPRFVTAYPSRR
jgi:hypothetical protein